MKLSRETRDMLQIGDKLLTGGQEYIVTNKWISGRFNQGISITVADKYNRHIYGDPLSNWYGSEIVKGD